jgi:hypothetical protein
LFLIGIHPNIDRLHLFPHIEDCLHLLEEKVNLSYQIPLFLLCAGRAEEGRKRAIVGKLYGIAE